jgi:Protein of unknown function (DUF5818)
MQKFAVLMALLMAVTFMPSRLQAQNSDNSSQNGAAGSETTVQGCLKAGRQAGRFMLTADDGTVYHLRSRQVKLDEHVGHEVEVTGRVPQPRGNGGGQAPSASSSDNSGASMSGSTQNGAGGASGATGGQNGGDGMHGGHMLIVTSVKHISDTCKTK